MTEEVTVTPLEFKFVRFELIGPKSSITLSSVLTEIQPSADYRMEKTFSVKPCALPNKSVLALSVRDPRTLKLVPPSQKVPRVWKPPSISPPSFLLEWNPNWAKSPLWDVHPTHV